MSAECTKCGTDLVYPEDSWPVGECPACTPAARYRQARVLCGGEDPVEALGRIAEATGYARALQAERASNPEEDQHFLLSEHVADRLRDSEARDSLLDLVQRLLDHGPGGNDSDFAHVAVHTGRGRSWLNLREEARAKVAEIEKRP